MATPTHIELGALAPKLSEQLKDSIIPKDDLKHFDLDATAISRLHVRGMLNDSQTRQARTKLLKKLEATAKKVRAANVA